MARGVWGVASARDLVPRHPHRAPGCVAIPDCRGASPATASRNSTTQRHTGASACGAHGVVSGSSGSARRGSAAASRRSAALQVGADSLRGTDQAAHASWHPRRGADGSMLQRRQSQRCDLSAADREQLRSRRPRGRSVPRHAIPTPRGLLYQVGAGDRGRPTGFDGRAARTAAFTTEMGLQASAVYAAERAVSAFRQVAGDNWKPYEDAQITANIEQTATEAIMAALKDWDALRGSPRLSPLSSQTRRPSRSEAAQVPQLRRPRASSAEALRGNDRYQRRTRPPGFGNHPDCAKLWADELDKSSDRHANRTPTRSGYGQPGAKAEIG